MRGVGAKPPRGTADLPVARVQLHAAGRDLLLASAQGDATIGAFAIDSLGGGTFDLYVDATGYLETVVRGVTVINGGSTDVGTVSLAPGCQSAFASVQVLGDFNNWDESRRDMHQVSSCVWIDTLAVAEGCYFMKFRTNHDWGDDYGTCDAEDLTCQVPLSGSVCLVSGLSALGKISFPSTGLYVFRLDESSSTYEIHPVVSAVQRATWSEVKQRYR